ncbi:MAG: tyrosine-type recombinase/integrase [Methanomicrobiales archaeon]
MEIMHPEFTKLKKLDPVNQIYLEGYLRILTLKQLRPKSIGEKLWRVYTFLLYTNFKDLKQTTATDLEDFVIHRKTMPSKRGKPCSHATVQGDILGIKLFLRYLLPNEEAKLFENIKIKRQKNKLPVERLLSRSDIEKLVAACDTQRDRALIMLLWDSGCRISEILSRSVGHVEFDRYGAVIMVDGKTGQRRLRLTACVGDLQTWINVHPMKENPDAPLFITYNRFGFGRKCVHEHTVANRLKAIAELAKITKPVHPHAIRHARLTDLAKQGFSEMELRIIAGWEASSGMPAIYVHMSGADVEQKILQKAGLCEVEEFKDISLEAIRCPRCGTINAHDSMFCKTCSQTMTDIAARQINTMHQTVINNLDAISSWAANEKAKIAADASAANPS